MSVVICLNTLPRLVTLPRWTEAGMTAASLGASNLHRSHTCGDRQQTHLAIAMPDINTPLYFTIIIKRNILTECGEVCRAGSRVGIN